jgi:uncharacterized membrane protein YtjA (UPF0391 family)
MLKWAIIALVISFIAGAVGFTGIASAAATVAKILFGVFLVTAVVMLIAAFALGELVF